ncbi:Os12g0284800 [Oryza sativa Japonica Group]|uniref:Os12g0284800 protein n=1 Tax=Oryza sativa subsp. japonica TaxID=39947 RepID=A0A0N7KTW3_ORYSJ|nr:hypothetical protein EE612_058954 [Oryza sativa]BAT16738.1 Os12g0284800 [Oryza sativa Japonica Group]
MTAVSMSYAFRHPTSMPIPFLLTAVQFVQPIAGNTAALSVVLEHALRAAAKTSCPSPSIWSKPGRATAP